MNRNEAKEKFWKQNGVFERGLSNSYEKVIKSYFIGSEFDDFIDCIFNDFEAELQIATSDKTCDGCILKPKEGENYRIECVQCSRFYGDGFEGKKND